MKLYKLAVLLVLGLSAPGARAVEINIAVASNFTAAMNDIASAFEKKTGHKVQPAFGSSGKFYAQIKNGAPFQAFLSADAEKPLQLERDGLTVSGTRFTYAIGTLVLWSARPGFVDSKGEILKLGQFRKLAIANPQHAPYGAASVKVLKHFGLAETLQPKLVLGENIAQTFQFVDTENAELGFVTWSQIMGKDGIKAGSAWTVPTNMHNPIRQDAVLLKAGADSKAVRELLQFMRSVQAKSIISTYGYRTEGD